MTTRRRNVQTSAVRFFLGLAGFLSIAGSAAAPVLAGPGDTDPRDIAGCVLWLKADAGVVIDGNGHVIKWRDQSAQGHDFDKLAGEAPVLAKGLNDRPVVRFDGQGALDGVNDFSKSLSSHSLLLLARWTENKPEDCQRVLFGSTQDWAFGYQGGDDQTWLGGGLWIYSKDWNNYGPGSINTDWHLHTATMRNEQKQWVEFWRDDVKLMERRLSLPPGDVLPPRLSLGGKSKCEVAEVLMYDRALSNAELTELWKYLSAKYHTTSPAVLVPESPPVRLKESTYSIAEGPFKPDWRSFKQYECPEWFRDAKFGIWAHWGPQCQAEDGDWYAQHMYEQGSQQYQYHVANYGHPSKFGFKDLCNVWKAEKWDPENLIRLYKRAGARYFVALANHHDNFDNWNSKFQPWNSVDVGPKKDLVGTWAKVARENGLRFGVSVHAARALSWFDQAHGSDKQGPLAGVPYDGTLTRADGKGKWWEGLDPADLYGPKDRTPAVQQAFVDNFFNRVKDLIDSYDPDLLYFDDTVPPCGPAGMSAVAHLLNASLQRHGGQMEAVYCTKVYDSEPPQDMYKCLVCDFEGGRASGIQPYPWQTDTCIGNWHYLRGANYRNAESVVKELVDIVSKNGNLLVNIPVRGDGTIDEREMTFLAGLTAWMDVNSESIYGTRPWRVYAEGATDDEGRFNNGQDRPFVAGDIRFVKKGGVLYATLMAWPGERAVVKSLAKAVSDAQVTEVSLLGHRTGLEWEQTDGGLQVTMPDVKPCEYAFVLKIVGKDLTTTVGQTEPQTSGRF